MEIFDNTIGDQGIIGCLPATKKMFRDIRGLIHLILPLPMILLSLLIPIQIRWLYKMCQVQESSVNLSSRL